MTLNAQFELSYGYRIVARSAQGACTIFYANESRHVLEGPEAYAHLLCGNQAHAYASMERDKDALVSRARC
jgi:hypothetical protein